MNKLTSIEYSRYQKNNKHQDYLIEYEDKILFISQKNKKESTCVKCSFKKECSNHYNIISKEEKIDFLLCDLQDLSIEINDKKEILKLSIKYKKLKTEAIKISYSKAIINRDFISEKGMKFEKGEKIEISTYSDNYSIVKKENKNITHIENKFFNLVGEEND